MYLVINFKQCILTSIRKKKKKKKKKKKSYQGTKPESTIKKKIEDENKHEKTSSHLQTTTITKMIQSCLQTLKLNEIISITTRMQPTWLLNKLEKL
jgi:hypothetical protein